MHSNRTWDRKPPKFLKSNQRTSIVVRHLLKRKRSKSEDKYPGRPLPFSQVSTSRGIVMQKRRKPFKRPETNFRPESSRRFQMLNIRKLNGFRYDLKEILHNLKMDEKQIPNFMATVVTKASRDSIDSAKDYVCEKCDDGTITKDIEKYTLDLLDRYTKYR